MVKDYTFGILGVGPIGGIMAAHLAKTGHKVILFDHFKGHMDEIKNNGLIITSLREFKVKFPNENIYYSIDDIKKKEIDVLFIAVKAQFLKDILPKLKKVVSSHTDIISLQNGLDNEDIIAKTLETNNIFRMVVNYAGNLDLPGIIRMSFFNSPNYIGSVSPITEEKAKDFANIITLSSLDTKYTSDIKKFQWEKCILNTMSPICVTTRKTIKQMMDFNDTREIVRELMLEGISVAKANGIIIKKSFLKYCMDYLDKAGHHKVSMQADIERGNLSEIEFLNGKIVEYGKVVGIPTPINNIFVALIRGSELPTIQY